MKLTKKDQIYLIWIIRNASYDSYLQVSQNKRTLFVFSIIGIKLVPMEYA